MHTGAIAFGLFLMANRALGCPSRHIVVGVFGGDIAVATGAGIGPVDGSAQLAFIDKQGNGFARSVGFVQGFIRVAVQAGAILDLAHGAEAGQPATSQHHVKKGSSSKSDSPERHK